MYDINHKESPEAIEKLAQLIEAGTEKIKADQLELTRTIQRMHGKGETPSDIANKLNIAISTVYNNIKG